MIAIDEIGDHQIALGAVPLGPPRLFLGHVFTPAARDSRWISLPQSKDSGEHGPMAVALAREIMHPVCSHGALPVP
jgi:hypothetical protein